MLAGMLQAPVMSEGERRFSGTPTFQGAHRSGCNISSAGQTKETALNSAAPSLFALALCAYCLSIPCGVKVMVARCPAMPSGPAGLPL